ncbi:MAG: hypothetical protein JRJ11_12120 [Deltaproteobacteria bacterium]|nr:hypothetical protein [Deltaproteobacteria bacterium]MBW1910270.1 hypothetical protein [Deltaproteobacteria bacterium]MBW2035506.1 hypothetical protein [Deltaproteobacteria bacterium]MBW2357937.1 hypothetical protein [Deltaproteobacteria bacterium]
MKIIKSGLHPLYEQYSNQENRLTHALLHTIGSSELLLSKFLRKLVRVNFPIAGETYEITTQKVPFSHGDTEQKQVESIPDAWIVDKSSKLGIVIEVKDKKNNLRLSQLRRHTNKIRNYKHPYLLVITPDLKKPDKIYEFERKEGKYLKIVWLSWDEIYRWLRKLSISMKSKRSKETFLVASLQEYLERRREVLGFQGIYFPTGFNVLEAKFILNAEMEELEPTVKKMKYKELCERRPAITTFSQESVWDCFGIKEGFTKDLHVTLGINEKSHDISITVPNSAKQAWSRLKKVFSDEVEKDRLFSILESLRNKVPHLFVEFNQRHFIAQKKGMRDGYMEFDIDTLGAPFMKKNSKAKKFPMWWSVIEEAIMNKKRINGQVMFKSKFYFDETKGIEKPKFIKTAENTIEALKPLYDFLKEN